MFKKRYLLTFQFLFFFSNVALGQIKTTYITNEHASFASSFSIADQRAYIVTSSLTGSNVSNIFIVDLTSQTLVGNYGFLDMPDARSITMASDKVWIGTLTQPPSIFSFSRSFFKESLISNVSPFKPIAPDDHTVFLPKEKDQAAFDGINEIEFINQKLFATTRDLNHLDKPGLLVQFNPTMDDYKTIQLPSVIDGIQQYIFPIDDERIGVSLPLAYEPVIKRKGRGGIAIYNTSDDSLELVSFLRLPGVAGHSAYDKDNHRILVCDKEDLSRFFVVEDADQTPILSREIELLEKGVECLNIGIHGEYVYVLSSPPSMRYEEKSAGGGSVGYITYINGTILTVYNKNDLTPVCKLDSSRINNKEALSPGDLYVDHENLAAYILFRNTSISQIPLAKNGIPLFCKP